METSTVRASATWEQVILHGEADEEPSNLSYDTVDERNLAPLREPQLRVLKP